MKAEDTVWLAEVADELIGIVRIAPEEGTLVLRGMRLASNGESAGLVAECCGSWLSG